MAETNVGVKFEEFKLFASTGLVISVTDGIVSFIGASNVAYTKLWLF